MDFNNIEELSDKRIFELYENIIETGDTTHLSCQCWCNGVYHGDYQPGRQCTAYDGSVPYSQYCIYSCQDSCNAGNSICTCTHRYLNYWNPVCISR